MKEYTLQFLNGKSDKMFEYLRKPMPSIQNEDEVIQRLGDLGRMLAESGEFKAVAQYKVDEVTHGEIGKALLRIADERLPASTLNSYIKAAGKDWAYLVSSFDRINSAASKVMMAIQVMISYEKQKMSIL